MSRTVKKRDNTPNVKPVIKAELSEKNTRIRIAAVVLLIAVAACAFIYAINAHLTTDAGWITIEPEAASELNCGSDFVFQYCIGASGVSATVENKRLISLYTDATVKAYQLFQMDEQFEEVKNMAYINQHPNEVIEVDDVLYQAFSMLERYGNRNIYLGPVYSEYDNMFFCTDDSQIYDFDAVQNEELRSYFSEIVAFAQNTQDIQIELLGENQIRLNVSEEYAAYASEHDITDYIDFFWMKNAFIVDYLAEVMIENNYTLGSISSFNGFTRNLDDTGTSYSLNLFDRQDKTVYPAGVMQYTNATSIVCLRDYKMSELDSQYIYELDNGELRTSFIDLKDGLSNPATNNMVSYSKSHGCAEILLQMIPVYIADSFESDALETLLQEEIYSIYYQDSIIYYNDVALELTNLYDKEGVTYTTVLIP